MAPADDEASWPRQLLLGLGALVVISLLVGTVVGAVALGAAKLTGIDSASGGPTREPSLFIPSGTPSTSPEAFPDPSTASEPTPTKKPKPAKPTRTRKPQRPITLQAFPARVAPGEERRPPEHHHGLVGVAAGIPDRRALRGRVQPLVHGSGRRGREAGGDRRGLPGHRARPRLADPVGDGRGAARP